MNGIPVDEVANAVLKQLGVEDKARHQP
jgi:hypothetical protein